VSFQVEEALNRWEPRINLESVTVERDPGDPATLLISIDYKVRATDSRFNLVYPFYLERGEAQ
jgi:phage baseplate assembly protein W